MDNNASITNNMTPDNEITLDISKTKTLQIGYHAETIFIHHSDDDQLHVKEYIGNTNYEYLAKVSVSRFKTSIRYGRRESVNTQSYVGVFLPKNWHGELSLYTQYGHITSQETLELERFAAETSEGSITLTQVKSPRIRLASSSNCILLQKATGFVDIHTTSGDIAAYDIEGGATFETSTGIIDASFLSLNNIIQCNTLSGNIQLTLPKDCGMNIDGISKTGEIQSAIEGTEIKLKPGNVKNIYGTIGKKPIQNIRLSTINGSIFLH